MRAILSASVFMVMAGAAFAQPSSSNPPASDAPVVQQGQASYFNQGQNGHGTTASGEPVQADRNTAASRNLPLGTDAVVTNKATGKSTQVKVNDRGPTRHDRVIDLSKKAAGDVGMKKTGTAPVTVTADPNRQSNPAVAQQLRAQGK